jgi:hypothetical protein
MNCDFMRTGIKVARAFAMAFAGVMVASCGTAWTEALLGAAIAAGLTAGYDVWRHRK